MIPVSSSKRPSRRAVLAAAAGTGAAATLLAGCGADGAAEAETASNADVTLPDYVPWKGPEPTLAGSADGPPDLYDHYPETPQVTISSPPGDGDEIRILTRTDSPIPPDHSRNSYWRALEERLGSPLDFTIVPATDWGTKFATIAAGGKLPDLMAVESTMRAVPQFLASETVDLQERLSGGGVNDYPFLANLPTVSWRRCAIGGGLRGIPIPRGMLSSTLLYGRADLLADRGITEPPTTLEDLTALWGEVTDSRQNTWALGNVPVDWLRAIVGVPNGWTVAEDGTFVSALTDERQEQALELARQIWASGVVDPDGFAVAGTAFKQKFGAGSILMMTDTYTAWRQFYQDATQEGFALMPFPLPSLAGQPGIPWIANATYGIASISKGAEDRLDTMLGVLNWLCAPFGTEEYLFRQFGLEGEHHTLTGSDPKLTPDGVSQTALGTRYIGDSPWPIYLPDHPDDARAEFAHCEDTVRRGVRNPTDNLYSATSSASGKALTSMMTDLQNDIVQNRQPVSAWRDGVASWRSGGGDAMAAEFAQAQEKAAT